MTRILNPDTPKVNLIRLRDRTTSEWYEWDQWPMVEVSVVCTTVGCPAEGVGLDVTVAENADSIYRVECARCRTEPEMHERGSIPTNNDWRHIPGRRGATP